MGRAALDHMHDNGRELRYSFHFHERRICDGSMKRTLLWLLFIAALVIGFAISRSRSRSNLNVEPHAVEVIEKAKER